jgi:2-dehydropantoate 2-reductase
MSLGPDQELPYSPYIAIVGAGAIGSYYGAKLARTGLPVSFIVRRSSNQLRANGLEIRCPEGDFKLEGISAYECPEEVGFVDVVIITIKTTDNHSLHTILTPLLGPETVICTLQNGLGNEEFLASIAGNTRIIGGICNICVCRPAPYTACKMAGGNIRISDLSGGDTARTHSLVNIFERAGIQCSVTTSVGLLRWSKLIWNIPFNGLSITEGGIDTASILSDPRLHQETLDLMYEVLATSSALGFDLDSSFPASEIARTHKMGSYKPSSLQDYLANKPVELDSIWGEPLRRGQAAEVPLPHLSTLYEKLKKMVIV